MNIPRERFNLYLLVALLATTAVACGCRSAEERKQRNVLSTFRIHLEASRDGTQADEAVPIYRARPVWVRIAKNPILSEANVSEAAVVEAVGGFALRIQFNREGSTLLNQYTAINRGRKMAIFSQFSNELKEARWLAAPVINRHITDGVLIFTPDATRAEAAEIALGLNNVSRKARTWVDR